MLMASHSNFHLHTTHSFQSLISVKYGSRVWIHWTILIICNLRCVVLSKVDRLYLSAPPKIVTIGHEKKRTLVLRKKELPDVVVWNPWDKKAKAMPDFGAEEYNCMLYVGAACIEKPITLRPGEEWQGRQEISSVPSSYSSGQLDPEIIRQMQHI